MDQDDRGTRNRGLTDRDRDNRGTAANIGPIRAARPRVAQAGTPTPSSPPPLSAIPSNSRTIFVANTDPFKSLQKDYRDSAMSELIRIYRFVGAATGQKAMTVQLFEPQNFPEVFSFSDAVIVTTTSTALLQRHVDDALQAQVDNAIFSLGQRGIAFTNPFAKSKRSSLNPERTGTSRLEKRVIAGRAFPFMTSVIALDEVRSDFVDEADSKIHAAKVRKRRASDKLDARHFASHRSLVEIAVLSVLDNPDDPTKWHWDRQLFGQLIGRAMAHEVRHLYVGPGHANEGLGADSANLITQTNFSPVDEQTLLSAIGALETLQGRLPVVPTFPSSRRTQFPF